MSDNFFKSIYLVCVEHGDDINYVIGRDESLKEARSIASSARTKWPEREIYITIEKIMDEPQLFEAIPNSEAIPSSEERPQAYFKPESATSPAAKNPSAGREICICGAERGECIGDLSCRCNSLAKCKNPNFESGNPYGSNVGWGLSKNPQEMHRTLVRVQDLKRGVLEAIIPGWDPHQVIYLNLNELPSEAVSKIKEGYKYFYAKVNLSADDADNLIIDYLGIGPKPKTGKPITIEDEEEDEEEDDDYEDSDD